MALGNCFEYDDPAITTLHLPVAFLGHHERRSRYLRDAEGTVIA